MLVIHPSVCSGVCSVGSHGIDCSRARTWSPARSGPSDTSARRRVATMELMPGMKPTPESLPRDRSRRGGTCGAARTGAEERPQTGAVRRTYWFRVNATESSAKSEQPSL